MFRRSNSGGLFFLQIETISNKNVKDFFLHEFENCYRFQSGKSLG